MAIGRIRTGHKIRRRSVADGSAQGSDGSDVAGLDRLQDSETGRKRLMAKAVRLLAQRSMSEARMRERLSSVPGADQTQVDTVIRNLKDRGFLDDRKYAEGYAAYRASAKPMGRSRMARELASRGLAKGDIDSTLEAVYTPGGNEELIDKAIEKRVRVKGIPSSDADIRRFFAYLARLGFDYDLISSRVRTLRRRTERESGS